MAHEPGRPPPPPPPPATLQQVISLLTTVVAELDAIRAILSKPAPPPPPPPQSKPTRVALALPVIKKKGKIMANFELADDTVAFIPVHVTDSSGDVVPAPSGDVFSAVSSDLTMMSAAIGVMPSGPMTGAVALVLTPLVKLAPGLTVTVTDTSALTSAVQIVDIVADLTPTTISLDTIDVVLTPQPVPAV